MHPKKKQKIASHDSSNHNKTKNSNRNSAAATRNDGPIYKAVAVLDHAKQKKQQTKILDSHPHHLLSNLLSPFLTPDEFLTNHFRQRAVYIPSLQGSARVDRLIEQYMFRLQPKDILENTASENIFVWLQPSAATVAAVAGAAPSSSNPPLPPKINSIEVPDAEMAFALYQAGHATYCRAPSTVEELLLGPLLENIGLGCGQYDSTGRSLTTLARAEVETFVSTTVGSVTGFHTDFQENFTIQLSGRKRWTLQRGTVPHVLRGITPHYAESAVEGQIKAGRLHDEQSFSFGPPTIGQNAEGPTDSVILEPGDVLYFPAGMWHQIEVLEPGVSINCSLMANNYATLVCQSLQHLLLQRPEWRASICRPSPGNGTKNDNITQTLQGLLEGLPNIIQEWTNRQGAAQGILPPVLQHRNLDTTHSPGCTEDQSDGWEEVEADNNSKESSQSDNSQADDHDDDSSSNDNMESASSDLEQEDDDPIIHLLDEPPSNDTFDPSPSALQEKCKTHKLVRNPLALLINEKEVLRHYPKSNGSKSEGGQVYILNVNYAGNEAHESHFRIRIRMDNEDKLEKLSPKKLVARFLSSKPSVIGWLIYFGYLVWTPRKNSA